MENPDHCKHVVRETAFYGNPAEYPEDHTTNAVELNGIVKRTVYDSIPVTIEYELTESAKQLDDVMNSMIKWGINHRKGIFEENKLEKAAG